MRRGSIPQSVMKRPLPALLSLVSLAVLITLPATTLAMSCVNENGKQVDWFIALKVPPIANHANTHINAGLGFYYADSDNSNPRLSDRSIADELSSIGRTMTQALEAREDEENFYAIYNDQHTKTETDNTRAHAKGVLAFNKKQGFWMIHSVPRFPNVSVDHYVYIDSGTRNGQTFICVTFAANRLQEIGRQIYVARLSIMRSNLPDWAAKHKLLKHAVRDNYVPKKACNHCRQTALKSIDGTWFLSYEKDKNYGEDLYTNLIYAEQKKSFHVQSWITGNVKEYPSTCEGKTFVTNVVNIKIDENTYWTTTKDHSKWAVSNFADNGKGMVCIGDINRVKSQAARGGGTLCLENNNVWKFFRNSVQTVRCCSSGTKISVACA